MLLLAAAAAAEPPICTDRPAKANVVCTVPEGRVQVESSVAQWSRTTSSGVTAKTLSLGSSVIKYGVSERSDLQVGFTPYVRVEADGAATSGFGDVTIRYKQRLTRDNAPVQLALIPFVKLPTAKRGIGNRKVEGGFAAPVSFGLGGITATLGPEADLLADADGHGRHIALVNLVNLSGTLAPRLTLAGELWRNFNFEPSGTLKQASADAALAYLVSEDCQLDVGANFGLNKNTATTEFYAGVSLRF